MSDDDYTPDDSGAHESDGHDCCDHDCDQDHAAGSFYEEQYAWDKIERESQAPRRGSCLLLLLAIPAGAWLLLA